MGDPTGELIHRDRWIEAFTATLVAPTAPERSVLVCGWNDVPGYDGRDGDKERWPETGGRPPRWVQLALTRGGTDADLIGGRQRRVKWYLQTLVVAPTDGEVGMIRDRLHRHRNRPVPIAHGSPLRLSDEDAVRPLGDHGLLEGETTWWYTARP